MRRLLFCALAGAILISGCASNAPAESPWRKDARLITGLQNVEIEEASYSVAGSRWLSQNIGCNSLNQCTEPSELAGSNVVSGGFVTANDGWFHEEDCRSCLYRVRSGISFSRSMLDLATGEKDAFFIKLTGLLREDFTEVLERDKCDGFDLCSFIFYGELKTVSTSGSTLSTDGNDANGTGARLTVLEVQGFYRNDRVNALADIAKDGITAIAIRDFLRD